MSVSVILGPPGTGKTTALLEIVGQEINAGIPADRIAFLSFTKRAATEAMDRAQAQFRLAEHELPYFRTLHSLAYTRLGTRREQMIQLHHYKDLGRLLGLKIAGRVDTEDDSIAHVALGDKLLFIENLARVQQVTLEEQFRQVDDDEVTWGELDRFARGLAQYKRETGLMDFTDLIARFNEMKPCPQLGALIVDEAQDLSSMQWEMVGHLSRSSRHVYFAGDDDQCIFKWGGADVNRFISLASDNTRVLEKSYRLKSAVYDVVTRISDRIKTRRPKTWHAKEAGGKVVHHPNLESVDISKGEWLLLARHNHQVKEMATYCMENGLPFSVGGKSPLTEGYVRHIIAWQDLAVGRRITGEHAKDLYTMMTAGESYRPAEGLLKRLAKTRTLSIMNLRSDWDLTATAHQDWASVLTRIPANLRLYYQLVLKRGESLTDAPRIRLSTIHGVKGGEADNVMLLTDLSKKTYEGYIKNPDDEHRVFYVAVSRAKETLHIVEPSGQFSYSID